MKTRRLASIIAAHARTAIKSMGSESWRFEHTAFDVSGEPTKPTDRTDQTPLTIGYFERVGDAALVNIIKAWLDFYWLPANRTDGQSGCRSHAEGGGYVENVHPWALVCVSILGGSTRGATLYLSGQRKPAKVTEADVALAKDTAPDGDWNN